jgi:hypothetical protein
MFGMSDRSEQAARVGRRLRSMDDFTWEDGSSDFHDERRPAPNAHGQLKGAFGDGLVNLT